MTERPESFDAAAARAAWDHAADAYAGGQASGRDFYRLEFFGPAQVALCGDVAGLRLLDVGCGAGYFAREMARRGARVTGVDLSPRMLRPAHVAETAEPLGVDYVLGDAERLDAAFPPAAFDMATSCVALQDVPDPAAALGAVAAVLRPGGRFVASITHPCTDTPSREWARGADGRKRMLCVDRYFDRAPLAYTWRGWAYEFTTPAVHATSGDWVGGALAAGFAIRGLHEPRPTPEAVRARPELEDAARVPYYLVLDLAREG